MEELGKRVREHLEMLFRPEFLDLGLEGGLVLIGQTEDREVESQLSNRNPVGKDRNILRE